MLVSESANSCVVVALGSNGETRSGFTIDPLKSKIHKCPTDFFSQVKFYLAKTNFVLAKVNSKHVCNAYVMLYSYCIFCTKK